MTHGRFTIYTSAFPARLWLFYWFSSRQRDASIYIFVMALHISPVEADTDMAGVIAEFRHTMSPRMSGHHDREPLVFREDIPRPALAPSYIQRHASYRSPHVTKPLFLGLQDTCSSSRVIRFLHFLFMPRHDDTPAFASQMFNIISRFWELRLISALFLLGCRKIPLASAEASLSLAVGWHVSVIIKKLAMLYLIKVTPLLRVLPLAEARTHNYLKPLVGELLSSSILTLPHASAMQDTSFLLPDTIMA